MIPEPPGGPAQPLDLRRPNLVSGRQMDCRGTLEHLDAFVDNFLPHDVAQAVGIHLQRCPACSREHHLLIAMKQSVCRAATPTPDEQTCMGRLHDFAATLARLAAEQARQDKGQQA